MKCYRDRDWSLTSDYPEGAQRLAANRTRGLLHEVPFHRLTMQQIVESAYLQGVTDAAAAMFHMGVKLPENAYREDRAMIPVSREFARAVIESARALRDKADQIVRDLASDESIKLDGSVAHACMSAAESARQNADLLDGWLRRHARDLGLQSEVPSEGRDDCNPCPFGGALR